MEYKNICELVRKIESDDAYEITHSKYVQLSMREDIEKTDAYLNSKHTSGETDSLGREKPFLNISIAARNIWYRATDIDRKNIKFRATKQKHQILAFIATLLLSDWMKKSVFGQYLNDWGLVLATYGSAISKFVEKDEKLNCEVSSWNRMLVDPIDFENNPKIEKLWLTPSQLKKNKSYDQKLVKKLLDTQQSRDTIDKQSKDNRPNYILLYEISGELPLYFLTDKEKDLKKYAEQRQIVSFFQKKDSKKGEFEDYTLYKGKADEVYDIAHLIKQDGYTFSGGAVKNLFENQWMVNHTAKTIKDLLDLSSMIFFQTSDPLFLGRNASISFEQGAILITQPNQPLTQLNNKADTTPLHNQVAMWKSSGNETVSISESMFGLNPPAGTAWRQTEALLRESHSLFELMRENKGLAIERILRKFVIPFLKTKMDNADEISSILDEQQITELDSMYVPNEAIRRTNNKIKQTILNGGIVNPEEIPVFKQQQTQQVQNELNQMGNQRFIKPSEIPTVTWKKLLKDFEWEIEVDITGESVDTQAALETLNTVLKFLVSLGGREMTPQEKIVFNKILFASGELSPLELNQVSRSSTVPIGGIVGGQEMVGVGQGNNIAIK